MGTYNAPDVYGVGIMGAPQQCLANQQQLFLQPGQPIHYKSPMMPLAREENMTATVQTLYAAYPSLTFTNTTDGDILVMYQTTLICKIGHLDLATWRPQNMYDFINHWLNREGFYHLKYIDTPKQNTTTSTMQNLITAYPTLVFTKTDDGDIFVCHENSLLCRIGHIDAAMWSHDTKCSFIDNWLIARDLSYLKHLDTKPPRVTTHTKERTTLVMNFVKDYFYKHRELFMGLAIALILDRYLLGGAFQERLKRIITNLLDKTEATLIEKPKQVV